MGEVRGGLVAPGVIGLFDAGRRGLAEAGLTRWLRRRLLVIAHVLDLRLLALAVLLLALFLALAFPLASAFPLALSCGLLLLGAVVLNKEVGGREHRLAVHRGEVLREGVAAPAAHVAVGQPWNPVREEGGVAGGVEVQRLVALRRAPHRP